MDSPGEEDGVERIGRDDPDRLIAAAADRREDLRQRHLVEGGRAGGCEGPRHVIRSPCLIGRDGESFRRVARIELVVAEDPSPDICLADLGDLEREEEVFARLPSQDLARLGLRHARVRLEEYGLLIAGVFELFFEVCSDQFRYLRGFVDH